MATTAPKKMTMMQLTVVVAVNMMGSGIIMLPTNMAQVGAISLLSWIVTALGSMAIANGFAQAGIFNQRPGGMAAYAEDAYGKPGYFQVFYLSGGSCLVAYRAVYEGGGYVLLPPALVPAFVSLVLARGAREAIEERRAMTVDLMYGDYEGGQRTVSRFAFLPRADGGWLLSISRHWNLDRPDPR